MIENLSKWLASMNMSISALTKKLQSVIVYRDDLLNNAVKGHSTTTTLSGNQFGLKPKPNEPFIKIGFPFIKGTEAFSEALVIPEIELTLNDAFTEHFGLTEADFHVQFARSRAGYLPWGADILSRLVVKEEDLVAFVNILALKFNAMKPIDAPYCERFIPSSHVVNVRLATGEIASASLNCLHHVIYTHRSWSPLRHLYTFHFSFLESRNIKPIIDAEKLSVTQYRDGSTSEETETETEYDDPKRFEQELGLFESKETDAVFAWDM